MVLLGAADDGSAVLLRCRFLCPQEDVSVPSERRASLQRLLHQTPCHLTSFPAAGEYAGLWGQRDDRWRPGGHHHTPGIPATAWLCPYDDGPLPSTSILLQPPASVLRTNISKQRQEVTSARQLWCCFTGKDSHLWRAPLTPIWFLVSKREPVAGFRMRSGPCAAKEFLLVSGCWILEMHSTILEKVIMTNYATGT